jgi:amino acid transporter
LLTWCFKTILWLTGLTGVAFVQGYPVKTKNMAKIKKFGTFNGVFTPSILTILGVIMYLRFPMIIGQAGLINTIGIILIAHIISITTSLSVASLSTDKPVQSGGTYFMISRSLGLPIGGTLGFALFVGLSFSVSLYLIGFAESFLQYWGFGSHINNIRITGTIVLVAVTTITFISTSLAIKSQYIIMAAIGLSLLSIFFGRHEFAPTQVNMQPMADALPFMVLFGIFFPAVTGFEAGVSMSGDLQNPKKSLPMGTIMAVGIGFVVYLGLALFFGYTVEAGALAKDPEILFKIALVPELVIAGIWGATLSSALGSILGAPRILQAIAKDKIAPRIFARGTGKTNEPRNALILAFLIAEGGILIGQLDVIARVVSMFFITTYAFLNMASAIESWSSSDFRPAFKIPRFVSILGALSAFIVMVLLDFLALAGATIVLGLLYFFLQRKQLILESGDAWSSFWTNLAKRSLLRLSVEKTDKRNWRPNIILFSGGTRERPHLIDLGLSITGKLGALTDFNLIAGTSSPEIAQPGALEDLDNEKEMRRYFKRQFPCKTILEGIQSVTSVYGFSGFEPNTILMGWSRNANNTDFLITVLKDLKSKKLNAVFLDYKKEKGFGKKETIDIWWNGKGRHLSFSLGIMKFLLSDHDWRDAVIRIMIINNDTSVNDIIYRNTDAFLSENRIKAEIKIVSNDFGSRSKASLIRSASAETDLVLLGLSHTNKSYTPEYIEEISKMADIPSSLLFLRPTDEFEEINLVDALAKTNVTSPFMPVGQDLPPINEIANIVVRSRLLKLDAELIEMAGSFVHLAIDGAVKQQRALLKNLYEFTVQNQQSLEREVRESDKFEQHKAIVRNHQLYLRNINLIVKTQNNKLIGEAKKALDAGIAELQTRLGNLLYEAPDHIQAPFFNEKKKKESSYWVPFQRLIGHYVNSFFLTEVTTQLNQLENKTIKLFTDLKKNIFKINDQYDQFLLNTKNGKDLQLPDNKLFQSEYDRMDQFIGSYGLEANATILSSVRKITNQMAFDLSSPEQIKKSTKKPKTRPEKFKEYFDAYAETWGTGIELINNTLFLDSLVLSQQKIAQNIIQKCIDRIGGQVSSQLLMPMEVLMQNIEKVDKLQSTNIELVDFPEEVHVQDLFKDAYSKVSEIVEGFPGELMLPDRVFKDIDPLALSEYSQVATQVNKAGTYYIDTLFYEPFYREVEKLERTVRNAIIECKEANSLLLFRINNIQSVEEDRGADITAQKSYSIKLADQVLKEKNKLEKAMAGLENTASDYLQEAFSKLFYHAFLEAEKRISTQKREQQGRRFGARISKYTHMVKSWVNKRVIDLLNSTSSGIILSRKYLTENRESPVQSSHILDLVEGLLPPKGVYNNVPIFYRSLMSSGSKINEDFWVARDTEMELVRRALQRHKNGVGGAVLIKGPHGAGKTTFSRYAVNRLFKKDRVYWVNAPLDGSVNQNDFLNALRKSVQGMEDFTGIFENMPPESTMVINDLELWWERAENGTAVLEKLMELIHRYGRSLFFIITCNTYALNIIEKLMPIGDSFLSVINCGTFNAKELKHLIMSRHKSSGIMLKYNGRDEDNLSQLRLSLLFNALFNFSKGVPGVAMNAWKANIVEAGADSITIRKPRKPNVEVLESINADWLVVIALFIQHKNLDVEKLSRITGYDHALSGKILNNLLNAGIIVFKTNVSFTLGRNIEPFLVDVCLDKGII